MSSVSSQGSTSDSAQTKPKVLLAPTGCVGTTDSAQTKPKVLLAATGCAGATKFGVLWHSFNEWAEVRVIITQPSKQFIDHHSLPRGIPVFIDGHEFPYWKKIGDSVLHIDLCKWADALVIAPLSANTLAKIAGGLCDNLLTCVTRAWDYSKPVFVAPCMETTMWNSSLTENHLITLDDLGVNLIRPSSRGESVTGAMAEPEHISLAVQDALQVCFDQRGSYKNTKPSSS